ncbi:MAG: TlyA family RNA methyltransferase [Alphaproteobacteria bacterium]|nr:TlyA family RNA methyltransferase [Alphaproteobacteria bacterium]
MRLDLELVSRGIYPTRAKAVAAIKAGLVTVNGRTAQKPSQQIADMDEIIGGALPYVSGRGSLKLLHALDLFGVNPSGYRCLDVGASTGGFTEVLLSRGAAHVIAVDVGSNQLISEIKNNPRVTSLEQTDIRTLPPVTATDLIVVDVSFISLTNIADVLAAWNAPEIIVLIKPQFEVAREIAARTNGVIKSAELHRDAINRVADCFSKLGYASYGVIESPILGGSGNTEFLAYLKK